MVGAVLVMAAWPGASASAQTAAPAQTPTPAQAPAPVDVTGATQIEYDGQTQQYVFRGPRVVVVRGTQRLEAPEIQYDAEKRVAILPRGGILTTPTMSLEGDQITADLGTRHFLGEGRVAGRFLDEGVWTSLHAARVEADDRPDLRRAVATGAVVATRNDQELRGDRVVYDRLTRHGTVEGHAVLTQGGDRLQADQVVVELATDDAQASGHVQLDRTSQQMHGSGDTATYSGRTQTAVLTGQAAVERGRDRLTADRITVHLDRNEAIADGHARIVAYPREGAQDSQP